MQVVGVGTDIVQVARVQQLFSRYGNRFLNKIFSAAERDYCLHKAQPSVHLAGRFAAKEAVAKACYQAGWEQQLGWLKIQVTNDSLGRPTVSLPNEVPYKILLSIAHERQTALAFAIALAAK